MLINIVYVFLQCFSCNKSRLNGILMFFVCLMIKVVIRLAHNFKDGLFKSEPLR